MLPTSSSESSNRALTLLSLEWFLTQSYTSMKQDSRIKPPDIPKMADCLEGSEHGHAIATMTMVETAQKRRPSSAAAASAPTSSSAIPDGVSRETATKTGPKTAHAVPSNSSAGRLAAPGGQRTTGRASSKRTGRGPLRGRYFCRLGLFYVQQAMFSLSCLND